MCPGAHCPCALRSACAVFADNCSGVAPVCSAVLYMILRRRWWCPGGAAAFTLAVFSLPCPAWLSPAVLALPCLLRYGSGFSCSSAQAVACCICLPCLPCHIAFPGVLCRLRALLRSERSSKCAAAVVPYMICSRLHASPTFSSAPARRRWLSVVSPCLPCGLQR